MICQNCRTEVADDLVFCTECGSRLHETISSQKTVIMPESVVTKVEEVKPKSTLKVATIIVGIIALFTVLGVAALMFFNPFAAKPVSQNTTPKPSRTPTAKPVNQNKNANISANNSNANVELTNVNSNISENANANKEPPKLATVIFDDRINLYADSSSAYSFTVRDDLVKIEGEAEILSGEQFEGYVFLQQVYDEHGVKPEMKMFSFETNKVQQFLPKGDYVLVLANSDGKGVSLKGKFTQTPANPAK
jgi:hypothetical protein